MGDELIKAVWAPSADPQQWRRNDLRTGIGVFFPNLMFSHKNTRLRVPRVVSREVLSDSENWVSVKQCFCDVQHHNNILHITMTVQDKQFVNILSN